MQLITTYKETLKRSGKDLKEKQERLKGPTKTLNWRGPPQLSTRLGGEESNQAQKQAAATTTETTASSTILEVPTPQITALSSQEPIFDGRSALRQKFLSTGIGEEATNIMLNSVSENTLRQYLPYLRDWLIYCSSNNISTNTANISQIITYLTVKFDEGFYRLRPNNPKYQFTWNVSEVFNYLELHQMDTKDVKFQTKKTAMLFALATGQRAQTLASVEIDKIKIENDKICITISKLLKTSGPYRQQPLLVLPFFDLKPNVCPARAVINYLKLTEQIRGKQHKKFIYFI
ncbi:unnamed protein product [Parnassius apollo]|uniref:(apollo) hypothetical protein n=1 Tax=Parnassius apollo TaxID=110799 RepID=A0A8S3WCN0_PARAO|nr:unnamed protein product [Parnassius apollo]